MMLLECFYTSSDNMSTFCFFLVIAFMKEVSLLLTTNFLLFKVLEIVFIKILINVLCDR